MLLFLFYLCICFGGEGVFIYLMRSYLYGMWIYRLLHLGPGMLLSSVWTAFQAQSREGLAIFGLPRKEILCFSLPYRPCPDRMKPAMKIMFFLCLFAGTWIAEAGKGQREAKGQGRRYDGRSHKDSHRSSYEYDYYDHGHDRRGSSHSRRRRRRRSSDSRTPDRHRRRSAEKPPKNSPGYEEYKRQKQEAAAWQERHLQAQALALCLEERERQKISAQQQPAPVVSPPAPAAAPEIQPAQSSGLEIPPLPQQECKTQVQPKGKGKPQPAQSDKIPVAYLKLLEAELGHIVNFGNKPLTVGAVESQLQAVKPAGKRLDGFLTRYGQKAPPTRIAAKIKMAAALLKELQFWNITICVGCWLFWFWCGYFVHVWKPVSFFPIPHYWTRSLELFQAWYTIHISHSDVAWYWESLSGIPILAPGATVVFAAVCKKFLKSHILELMWVGCIFQRMMAGMDF